MSLNLKAHIGTRRDWTGKGEDRHEFCNVTVWEPSLIVGGGHLADLRIDVARALVALAESASADKVLIALSDAISAAEASRKEIASAGTGRKYASTNGEAKTPAESPLLKTSAPVKDAPRKARKATRIGGNAVEAPAQ